MGIGLITALEIFTNPDDLEIVISRENDRAKFAVSFSRGPGHNFKLLLTLQPFAKKLEDAVEVIRETLETIRKTITKDFVDSNSFVSQFFNPYGIEIKRSNVLNPDMIALIVEELRQHRTASTHKMFAHRG